MIIHAKRLDVYKNNKRLLNKGGIMSNFNVIMVGRFFGKW